MQYTRRLLLHKQTAILTVSYLCYLMEYTQGLETQDFASNLVKGTTHALLCGLSKLLSTITIPCSKFTSCCYTPYDLYWMCFVAHSLATIQLTSYIDSTYGHASNQCNPFDHHLTSFMESLIQIFT